MRWRAVGGVLAAVGLLILLIIAAQAWLSTGIGRGVLETRLSTAFGRPVRLDGEFDVGILPVPGASGTELKLFTRDGRWLAVEAGSFLARLALRPLLKGEVEVTALRLEDAGIDLGKLAREPRLGPQAPGATLRIPDIRSFELSDLSLYFEGMGSQPHVHIAELSVEHFHLDTPAPFEAKAAVISGENDMIAASTSGTLTLQAEGVAEASLSQLDVAVKGWAASGLKGGFSADLNRANIVFRLEQTDRPFSVKGRVSWKPDFAGDASGYRIEEFEIASGLERITGKGCLLDGLPPVLHAELAAQSIDLDALQSVVETWRVAGDSAAARSRGSSGARAVEAGGDDLPFDLALRLELEQATYGGAVAEGVLLRAGAEPKCP